MESIDLIKFVLFVAMLGVVALEFLMILSPPSAPSVVSLLAWNRLILGLGIIEKVLIVALFGILTFPKKSKLQQ